MKHSNPQIYADFEAEMAFERHLSRMKDKEIDFIPPFATPDHRNTEFYKTLLPVPTSKTDNNSNQTRSIFAPILRIFNWSR